MAISIRNRNLVEFIDAAGHPHSIGIQNSDPPITVSATNEEVVDFTFSVAASGTQKLWDTSDNTPFTTFTYAVIVTDRTGFIQTTTFSNALWDTKDILANLPFVLHGDAQHQNDGTVALFDDTADTIEEIHYSNSDSTNAAKVRIVIVE